MKLNINTHKDTKKMLNIIRGLKKQSDNVFLLNEQEENKENNFNVNNIDIKILYNDINDKELTINQQETISKLIDSFKTDVTTLFKGSPGITIKDNQIRFDGTIIDTNIKFTLVVGDENGVYINADMLSLNNDVITLLTKINKFFITFKNILNEILMDRSNN